MLGVWNWLLGGPGLIILQCAWCCRVNRCGLITAGVFEALAGIGSIVLLGAEGFIIYRDECEVTDDIYTFYDDDFALALGLPSGEAYSFGEASTICNRSKVLWFILPIIGGGMSILSAILVFVFAFSRGRYEACQEELDAWEARETKNQRRAVDVPMGSSDTAAPEQFQG